MARLPQLDIKSFIRDVPDFPKPGILFKDITPLLSDPTAFGETIGRMADLFRDAQVEVIVAAEARGFIFAAPLALELNAAFVPVRKPGKLPYEKHSFQYDLEYGQDTLEMHKDAVKEGQRVLVVDDLLATGGTVGACCKLLSHNQAKVVGCLFCIELEFLNGRNKLAPYKVESVLKY
jgi:adenine phosphoribosyltransferase